LLRLFGRDVEHADLSLSWPYESRHQVHERGLAAAVGAHQAGNSGRDRQMHAVHAEHLAVEARHVIEHDARFHQRTTSAPRILTASRYRQNRQTHASAATHTGTGICSLTGTPKNTAPSRTGGLNSPFHTVPTRYVRSMMWPHLVRITALAAAAKPELTKNAPNMS